MCSLNNLKKKIPISNLYFKNLFWNYDINTHLSLTFLQVITFCRLDELMVFTENKMQQKKNTLIWFTT